MKTNLLFLLFVFLGITTRSQDFGPENNIIGRVPGVVSIFSSDIDGDGDNDVLTISKENNKVSWFRKEGDGSFSSEIIISTSAIVPIAVCAKDLDGDEDQDVLVLSELGNKLTWYENDGEGNFSLEIIISNDIDGPQAIFQ